MPIQGVIVLGMHRSGTSAVTRAINLLGIPLGRADDLYAAPDNPAGHWESVSLCASNDAVLRLFAGWSVAPPRLGGSWELSGRALGLTGALKTLFAYVYEGNQWLWKDPRLCLTLPIWRRLLGEFVVVFVVRQRAPVVNSLSRRSGYPRWYCEALWERYNRSTLSVLEGLPSIVVQFEELMADPRGEIEHLASGLAALGVALSGSVEDAVASLRPDILHPGAEGADTNGTELMSVLSSLPRVSGHFEPPPLAAEPSWIQPAFDVGRLWLAGRRSLRRRPA